MALSASMPVCESDFTKRASLLRSGASLLAVCAFAAASPAMAQGGPAAAPQSTANTAGQVQQSDQNPAPESRTSQSTGQTT